MSVVLDNARYQHCRAVMEKATELDIQLVFLPPYSPNLNIIERLWKYARKQVLAGRYFDTPAKFHEALRCFFDEDFGNHKEALRSLLTLKFQSFENAQILCARTIMNHFLFLSCIHIKLGFCFYHYFR